MSRLVYLKQSSTKIQEVFERKSKFIIFGLFYACRLIDDKKIPYVKFIIRDEFEIYKRTAQKCLTKTKNTIFKPFIFKLCLKVKFQDILYIYLSYIYIYI